MTFGAAAEDAVEHHLRKQGYEILGRNVRTGRLELDIVATRGKVIAVVEVRARRNAKRIHPALTIKGKKLQRIRHAAARWSKEQRFDRRKSIRIDAAAVTVDANGEWQIEYYENVSMPTRVLE